MDIRLDAFNLKNVSIMSQIETVSYPKINQRPDGRIEVIVNYQGKRMRLQNGNAFSIPLKPNSFPIDQRANQAKILAAQIYSKLIGGFKPKVRGENSLPKDQPDIYYIKEALHRKLKQGFSNHYNTALLLAFKRIIACSKGGLVDTSTIEIALGKYANNTSYNTLRRNMNILCNYAVRLGMDHNPVDEVKRKKEKAHLNKSIDNPSILLSEIKAYNFNLFLCCLLTYGCLLRPHREVRELKWGDFTEDLSYIRLSGSRNKSGRNRIVPVPQYVQEFLKKKRGPSQHILWQGRTVRSRLL